MKATIQTATDRRVELAVTDNDGERHRLAIDRTGAVEAHRCEGYPPAADRTERETAQVDQAERFAKYVAFRKFGFDAIAPYGEDDRIAYPDRVAATALVVGAMAPDTFHSHFDAAYRQHSCAAAGEEPPVTPPAAAPDAACERIEQDVFLAVDDERLRPLLDVLIELEGLGALRQSMDARPNRDDRDLFARLDAALAAPEAQTEGGSTREDASSRFVAGTSPLCVHWRTDGPRRVEYEADDGASADGPLGARLQLPVGDAPAGSVAAFQRTVVDHLLCQVRDCYVGMGLAPPRDLRVRGPGIAWFSRRYERTDVYQRYHDPEAIVDWTRLAPIPRF